MKDTYWCNTCGVEYEDEAGSMTVEKSNVDDEYETIGSFCSEKCFLSWIEKIVRKKEQPEGLFRK
jgi:hypothetical protein